MDLSGDGSGDDTVTCQLRGHPLKVLAGVRGASAVVCTLTCAVLLGVICRYMNWRSYEHRLLVYVTSVSLLRLLSSVSQSAVLGQGTFSQDVFHGLCSAIGMLAQFTSWLQLLTAAWILAYLWLSYGQPSYDYYDPHRALRRCKREILPLCLLILWAAVFTVIPAATGKYGETPFGSCWIRPFDSNCDADIGGVAEQWVLWYGWKMLLMICTPVVLIYGVYRYHKVVQMTKSTATQTAESYAKKARASIVVFVTYITFYLLVYLIEVCIHFRAFLSKAHTPKLPSLLVTDGIIHPIKAIVLPLLALLYFYYAGKFPTRNYALTTRIAVTKEIDPLL